MFQNFNEILGVTIKKAWMNSGLFTDWIKKFNEKKEKCRS